MRTKPWGRTWRRKRRRKLVDGELQDLDPVLVRGVSVAQGNMVSIDA